MRTLAVLMLLITLSSGCGQPSPTDSSKRPRPVSVVVLSKRLPPEASLVSASIGSWKTEQIGFEVGGRIEYVVEPNTEVEGRVFDKNGNLVIEGTPIGRIESERYSLQVARAKAEVTRAEQSLIVAETDLNERIPAQLTAAKATLELAQKDYERNLKLFNQDAATKTAVDRDKAQYENAAAEIRQLDAAKKAKQAEIQSLQNSILQAKQNLRDAERDLEDCTLYSSFRGQVADISVVPGSVVSAGQPAVTVQMMNPIKVELEVSAEESRRLQRTELLPVHLNMPDGTTRVRDGFLYLVDPVADPLTRTFTVTLLVMNEKLVAATSDETVATTDQTWRVDFKFLPGADEGRLFVDEQALLQDGQGYYVWQVTDPTVKTRLPTDRLFQVRKLRVELGDLKIPYLGNWVFQEVKIGDEEFDPENHLVCGKLHVSEGTPETWDGDTVFLDSGGQWMMRPGDLVRVDLSASQSIKGFYVPMDAIIREGNRSFIFVVEGDADPVARKVAIQLIDDVPGTPTSSMRRIEPLGDTTLEGERYIIEGAHYLIDGEPVKIASSKGDLAVSTEVTP